MDNLDRILVVDADGHVNEGAIEDVERSLRKPVVTSNQAVLWSALRRLQITQPIAGLGRLFEGSGVSATPS